MIPASIRFGASKITAIRQLINEEPPGTVDIKGSVEIEFLPDAEMSKLLGRKPEQNYHDDLAKITIRDDQFYFVANTRTDRPSDNAFPLTDPKTPPEQLAQNFTFIWKLVNQLPLSEDAKRTCVRFLDPARQKLIASLEAVKTGLKRNGDDIAAKQEKVNTQLAAMGNLLQ